MATIAAGASFEALTALGAGALKCGTLAGKVAHFMDDAAAVVGVGQNLGDMAQNGVNVSNSGQMVMNAGSLLLGRLFRNCFPAGTLVSTEAGRRPIEQVQAGQRVWSFHHGRNEWVLRPVLETYQFVNDEFAEIQAGGEKIVSTQGHPFWVLRGEDLENRPRGEHITSAEEELLELRSKVPGRWVDAGDLREGDVLLLDNGQQRRIERVTLFEETQPTYNFAVDVHNYAVGECGVLVHNRCKTGPKTDPNAPHNRTIREIGDDLERQGNRIVAGGGWLPEQLVKTAKGFKAGRRPDIIYRTPSGELRGVNVGLTNAAGLPVTRELKALADLNGSGLLTLFMPYIP